MSKHDEKDDTVYPCGCVKAKALDIGHYCSQIPEDFKVAYDSLLTALIFVICENVCLGLCIKVGMTGAEAMELLR